MIEDEAMRPRNKAGRKRRKVRALAWLVIVLALLAGAGFVATQGDLGIADTLASVREISGDATEEIRSTVDSAIRTEAEERKIETRLTDLEARISFLEENLRQSSGLRDADEQKQLARRIEFELFSTQAFDLEAIHVTVAESTVTLAGTVRSEAERLLAERVVEEVPGVVKVANELRLASSVPSPHDD